LRPYLAGAWGLIGTDSAGNSPRAQDQRVYQAAEQRDIRVSMAARYGVVFWRLLAREADWLPPWRDLLRVYRRLEARGDVRGGRFVAGFSGEQYALPEAIGTLREVRRQQAQDAWVSLSGADPLNLAGILTPGPRLAALTGNRLLHPPSESGRNASSAGVVAMRPKVAPGSRMASAGFTRNTEQVARMYLPPVDADQAFAKAIIFGRHLLHRRHCRAAGTLRLLRSELLHRLEEMQRRRVIAACIELGTAPCDSSGRTRRVQLRIRRSSPLHSNRAAEASTADGRE
jgi:hypothetical protein